jgi:3-methyladenine DNA glycosylase/8-oxoguanine DNA glycosylase
MGEMKFTLNARPPFALQQVVKSHGWVQLAPFKLAEGQGNPGDPKHETVRKKPGLLLSYIDRLPNGRVIEYKIRQSSKGVQVETENLDKLEKAEASKHIHWMLGLDLDYSEFYKVVRTEPKLAHARRAARGRILRSATFFEDVVKTILTTNTQWAATIRMNLNLINTFASTTAADGKKAFPTPAQIAAARPDVLRKDVRVGYRAPALHELAVRVASGELDLEAFKHSPLPTDELRAELLKINGVGPYAAANLLMILGRHDFIPIDSWALKLVSHEWYRGKPVTPKQVERRFNKWGSYKGLAYWLWDWKFTG